MRRRDLTFRVFFSSTFGDFLAERNALQERVFPRLAEHCQAHGGRFQPVDLRWGVSRQAANDQQTMRICLDELRRCQALSPRPNFVLLLGQRYGWRPLPEVIDAAEFDLLAALIPVEDRPLLAWYCRDDNSVPSAYHLRPRARTAEPDAWALQEPRLRSLLQTAAAVAFPDPVDPRRRRYEDSATHQEARLGLLDASDDGHVLACLRTIHGLPMGPEAAGYRDLDSDASLRIEALRNEVRGRLPLAQLVEYTATWDDPHRCAQPDLDTLCQRIEEHLRGVIDREAAEFQQGQARRESEVHAAFGDERSQHFVGREDLLTHIREYVAGPDARPLIVVGPGGCGKTALLGQVRREAMAKATDLVIARFIGADPASTGLRSLLGGICRDLAAGGGESTFALASGDDPGQAFLKQLTLAGARRRTVVLIDGLDHLGADGDARSMNWLPPRLPPGVKLIASVLRPSNASPGPAFAALVRSMPDSLLDLGPLTPEQGSRLLDAWLTSAGRHLQPAQRHCVLERFARCPLPLYLKLAYEEARYWSSEDIPDDLADSTSGLVARMLARLEGLTRHGAVLVSRTMGYLTAARHGLGEDELLDVLSLDPEVMADFRARSPDSPPIDRLPFVVWARLLADLDPYLARKASGTTSVLTTYHRDVSEAVASRYLAGDARAEFSRRLADYFACPLQPLRPTDGAPNRRRLAELPYLQTRSGRWQRAAETLADPVFLEAKLAVGLGDDLLADYVRVGREGNGVAEGPDSEAVERCRFLGRILGNALHAVTLDPGSVVPQLLLEMEEAAPAQFAAWRDRWAGWRRPGWTLSRLGVTRRPSTPYLAQIAPQTSNLHSLCFSADSETLLFSDVAGRVYRWHWPSGDQSISDPPGGSRFRSAAVLSDREIVLTCEQEAWLLRVDDVWRDDLASGSWHLSRSAEPGYKLSAAVACLSGGWALLGNAGPTDGTILRLRTGQVEWETAWRLPWSEPGGPMVNYLALSPDGRLRVVCFGTGMLAMNTGFQGMGHAGGTFEAVFLPDTGQVATCGADNSLAIWHPRTGLVRRVELMEGAADCLDYLPGAGLFAVGHRSGHVTLVQPREARTEESAFAPGIRGWVLCLRFSPCGRYLAISGRNGILRVFAVEQLLQWLTREGTITGQRPSGPVKWAECPVGSRIAYFLDSPDHLYSTAEQADNRYLPQKCETVCVHAQLGPVALLTHDLRVLEPTSGKPLQVHPLPETRRFSASLTEDGQRLVVLEPIRVVVYRLVGPEAQPVEELAVSLADLRAFAGVTFNHQRPVPVRFCADGRLVVLSLEPHLQATIDHQNAFTTPPMQHALVAFDAASGRPVWYQRYDGVCLSLADASWGGILIAGFGSGRVHLRDAAGEYKGWVRTWGEEMGVLLLSLRGGPTERLVLPAEDGGVTAVGADPNLGLVLAGCASGRVRIAVPGAGWQASLALSDPILQVRWAESSGLLDTVDDGTSGAYWPAIHRLIARHHPPEQ